MSEVKLHQETLNAEIITRQPSIMNPGEDFYMQITKQNRAHYWKQILESNCMQYEPVSAMFSEGISSMSRQVSTSSQASVILLDDEISLFSVELNLENQRVVKADADRTRSKEMPNKTHLEKILTYYCKQQRIRYKQGLNDVLAPFLLLWHENQD